MSDRFIPEEYQNYILGKIAECDEQAMCSQSPTSYYEAVRPALWLADTLYDVGDLVYPPTPNQKIYECTVGGTSGSTEPGWGTTFEQTFTDGGATWTTHNNYALVNRTAIPTEEFTISDNVTPPGRKVVLIEKQGIITHTAGIVSHCALICATDRSLRFVTPALTTIGDNELESGRTTIFYALTIIAADPIAVS